ncbi:UNVERIFIED_ORG: hypothetical protein QFZ59_004686 [Bacillus sp. B2I3]|nr:hypothetical protein [Bacillus sp. B2I3]
MTNNVYTKGRFTKEQIRPAIIGFMRRKGGEVSNEEISDFVFDKFGLRFGQMPSVMNGLRKDDNRVILTRNGYSMFVETESEKLVRKYGEEIGTARFFMKHFEKFGSREDVKYFEGKRDGLQEGALLLGLDMGQIQRIAIEIESEQIHTEQILLEYEEDE